MKRQDTKSTNRPRPHRRRLELVVFSPSENRDESATRLLKSWTRARVRLALVRLADSGRSGSA